MQANTTDNIPVNEALLQSDPFIKRRVCNDVVKRSGLSGLYFLIGFLLFAFFEPHLVEQPLLLLSFATLLLVQAGIRLFYYVAAKNTLLLELPPAYVWTMYSMSPVWGLFAAWVFAQSPDFNSIDAAMLMITGGYATSGVVTLGMKRGLSNFISFCFLLPCFVYLLLTHNGQDDTLVLSILLLFIVFLLKITPTFYHIYWEEMATIYQFRQQAVALEKANTESLAANNAKSEFLANISHEIRTPLNGMIGMTELLTRTKLDEQQLAYLSTIKESGRLVVNLINNVLDFSQLNSGKVNIRMQPVIVSQIANEIAAMLQPLADQRRNKLIIDNQLPAQLTVETDKLRLQQLITNLLNNALKFTHNGTVKLILKLQEHNAAQQLHVEIIDTGIGIPAKELAAIFDAFHQVRNNNEITGTGLGLAICSKLVALLDGTIGVESEVGKGSRFWFSLPAQLVIPPSISAATTPAESLPFAELSRFELLVVEDNKVNQQVIQAYLTSLGYQFRLVGTGLAALQAYDEHKPDLVLLDCNLPDISGLTVSQRIREIEFLTDSKRTPIIALTANAHTAAVQECLAAGMDAHLGKPVTLMMLDKCLQRWLNPSISTHATR